MSKYKAYALHNYLTIPQIDRLSAEQRRDIEVVGAVLPFKVNSYVLDELIDWDRPDGDPIFHLTFPQRDMLLPHHYAEMAAVTGQNASKEQQKEVSNSIRMQLNPHPAGQADHNVPTIDGQRLWGLQHKYRETVLFFPSSGQTCHSYCSFCFRWPQFVGMDEFKFAMKETELLIRYLEQHQEVTDILFTGGDPMIMSFKVFEKYIEPFLADDNKTNIQTIRIGTKALAFWPYKFLTDPDADEFLRLFERITNKGINLAIMAHFSHPRELETAAVKDAIRRLRSTGAQIRTQSPILRHINDNAEVWADMWRKQVNLNCIPYYMFMTRDTGAQHYFALTLVEAWDIWRAAYQQVSGVCRTVRGPSMSCTPGKVQFLGVSEIGDKKVFVLRFLQGRNPNWVARPFFAEYDENAVWMDELKPAFADRFFFEDEAEKIYGQKYTERDINALE
ncbi:MAG: lysine 2,3-aminomutase [Bacteroidetes bacterium]|nr:lysine 2,3-aminomutase [Bacteroidota bacterium]